MYFAGKLVYLIVLPSNQLAINSVQQYRRDKCLGQSEARVAFFVFCWHNLVEEVGVLALCQVSLNSIQWLKRRSQLQECK